MRTGPGGRAVALRVALRIALAVALCTVPVHVLRCVCVYEALRHTAMRPFK